MLPEDRIMRLNKFSNSNIPPPDPRLIRVHLAVAQILHASGIGDEIDAVIRDAERIGHLKEDGSTDVERMLGVLVYAG